MSLRCIEGAPSEQFRSDISHASSLEDGVLQKVMEASMKFVSSGQEVERLISALAEISSEEGISGALLKHSSRGLVHISMDLQST